MNGFKWQDWVDAVVGCMKGLEESDGTQRKYGRTIIRGDARDAIVKMCPARADEGHVGNTGVTHARMGLPVFVVKLDKFVEQWLSPAST